MEEIMICENGLDKQIIKNKGMREVRDAAGEDTMERCDYKRNKE